jgi:RimJ/RimL family protein N-acetyltransferase
VALHAAARPRRAGRPRREEGGAACAARGRRALNLAGVLPATCEVVGDFALRYWAKEHRQGEIGFVVHPDHHGRGYATEGAARMLRYGFEEAGLHRIIGRLEARNEPSARVLERLGMRREAHFVENELVKGAWESEVVYALLAREWRAAQRTGL